MSIDLLLAIIIFIAIFGGTFCINRYTDETCLPKHRYRIKSVMYDQQRNNEVEYVVQFRPFFIWFNLEYFNKFESAVSYINKRVVAYNYHHSKKIQDFIIFH